VYGYRIFPSTAKHLSGKISLGRTKIDMQQTTPKIHPKPHLLGALGIPMFTYQAITTDTTKALRIVGL
jgi:hypothetical protein